ncbi:MAG: hypothetical protein Kow0047_33470 [Anaerolineae bacterium]
MSIVEEIKERLDIVEVISAYVPLQRSGRRYKGLCPFHTEKTPSFIVFPETGTWHCFGACGTGGDVFSFIMRRENLDFRGALELLARRAGVELEPHRPEDDEAERARARLRALCQIAAEYYHELLLGHPAAAGARDYVARRGITAEGIERFQLGFSLNEWEATQRYLVQRGFTLEEIVAAGLAVERSTGRGAYDRFRGRLMIPIRDGQGRVVGFGARSLDGSEPKYMNSPETPIFDKGRILFGLDMARQAIRDSGQVIIVEGYMDVITAHQHGYANVVASMGTALTESQLDQLKRLAKRFILALDPDVAGQQATLRGIDQARQALGEASEVVFDPRGLVRHERRLQAELRILSLPPGQDPDDFIRSQPQAWPGLVAQAMPVIDFYLRHAEQVHDVNTAQGKASIVAEIVPLIRELSDDVMRAHYIQLLARRVNVSERLIEQQVRAPQNRRAPVTRVVTSGAVPRRLDREEYALALLATQGVSLAQIDAELTSLAVAPISEDDFGRAEARAIFSALRDLAAADEPRAVAEVLPPAAQEMWSRIQQAASEIPSLPREEAPREIVNSVLRMRLERVRSSLAELQRLLEEAQSAGDAEAAEDYTALLAERTREVGQLQAIMASRTLLGRRPGG